MQHPAKSLLPAILACIALSAQAGLPCPPAIMQQLPAPADESMPLRSDCKSAGTGQQGLGAVALPERVAAADDIRYRLYVFQYDAASQRISSLLKDPELIVSDAIALLDTDIDSAAYQLAPQQRAFGVRLSFHNSSSYNSYGEQVLNLYLPGQPIKKVLSKLRVHSEQAELDDQRCVMDASDTDSLIIVAKNSHHGLKDLLLKTRAENSSAKPAKKQDDCTEQRSKREIRHTLHFNGEQYSVPKSLQGIQ